MKILSLIAVAALLLVAAAPSAFATCSARGYVIISPGTHYDHIANGIPNRDECWNPFNATYVTNTTSCGYSANAYEFAYAGQISQTVTIPSTMTTGTLRLDYLVDFIDPNNDAVWNKFIVSVWDDTAGGQIGTDYFDGGMGDLYCSLRSINLGSTNRAGHSISVHIQGSEAYPDTYIRVRSISLVQSW
ncbi:MAG TPA: hypothetical protein VGF69_23750 [Thermoanaerobaculia bacterium]